MDFENTGSSSSRISNWRKKTSKEINRGDHVEEATSPPDEIVSKASPLPQTVEESPTILTDDQINALASKLVKAEIMGKVDLVVKLKKKLADARLAREAGPTAVANKNVETVVLVKTNRQGMTHPVMAPAHPEPREGRRKDKRTETHSKGQRDRYFFDDDQRDLKEMVRICHTFILSFRVTFLTICEKVIEIWIYEVGR